MKILITTDLYAPVVNGVVTSVVNLKNGLEVLGHEVRILTLSQSMKSYNEDTVFYIGSLSAGKIYPNARVRLLPSKGMIEKLIEWHPDIVHSQCEFSTFRFAKRIAAACEAPLIHTYHTVYEDYTHYFSPSVKLGKKMIAAFTRRIAASTKAVIAPTDKVSRMLHGYGVTAPICTIPSGIDLGRFSQPMEASKRRFMREQYGVHDGDILFIFVGRLAKEKNLDELIGLFEHLPAEKAKLMLVGDGPYREELEGQSSRVIFTGMVEPARIPCFYQMGDVFVSASQSETQGLTYIEAMASGLAVLCRSDPCLDGVIESGTNGFLYHAEDEFKQYADALLSDGIQRKIIGQNARTSVEGIYSVDSFAKAVLALYADRRDANE